MGRACKRSQTIDLLDAQIGLGEVVLGTAVIPCFCVPASGGRRVRIKELDPSVTLEFHGISNRERKLQPKAIEFGTFPQTYIARPVGQTGTDCGGLHRTQIAKRWWSTFEAA
jgi:hypothetical protein